VPDVCFDSLDSAIAQRTDPQYTEFARLDEPTFIDMDTLRRDDRGAAILSALHDQLELTRARGFLCEELRVVDRREAGR